MTFNVFLVLFVKVPFDREYSLEDVPDEITIHLAKFTLVGCVVFEPPMNSAKIGHYSAVVKSSKAFILYDDMKSKTFALTNKKKMIFSSMLYAKTWIKKCEIAKDSYNNTTLLIIIFWINYI